MTQRTVPHELAIQTAIHTLWPAAHDLWEDDIHQARAEFAAFLSLLGEADAQGRCVPITVYADGDEAAQSAREMLNDHPEIVSGHYGDVWARDTGPVFTKTPAGLKAMRFGFNGWGGKYQLEGDQDIGDTIARQAGVPVETIDLICEGGALEFDGEGSCLTTRQCVLNSNRNPGLTETRFEDVMAEHFGITKIIWLDEGLVGDHTDGHIDNIARFAGPGVVVCQRATEKNDPNLTVLKEISRQLESAKDARGRNLVVHEIPSPGLYEIDRAPAAASHMNWVIGCRNVVMPAYNTQAKDAARILQDVFADRRVVTSPARHILTGGGAFHCVTCHQPAL